MSETVTELIEQSPPPTAGVQYSAPNPQTPGVLPGLPEPWRPFIAEDGRWGARVIWCSSTLSAELGTSLSGENDSHIMLYWDKSEDGTARVIRPHPRAPLRVITWIAHVNGEYETFAGNDES